jgi:hypothetical protein
MDDRFLNPLRQEPDPRFARGLREKLRAQETPARGALPGRLTPALAGAFALAVVVALFAFPSVRASAQAMLDLFRVKKFTALPFDQSRVDKLQQLDKDHMFMVFDKSETVKEPGPPKIVPSLGAASSAAGFPVATPSYLPSGLSADTIRVDGSGEAKLSVSEAKLRALLDALDLQDVQIPAGLDGKEIQVRKSPVVIQQFHGAGKLRAAVLQSNSPEIGVPAGVDVPRLAEIGLRILGLDQSQAHHIATTTDWRTTLLVPVPFNASTFRQVTVRGNQGLMITTVSKDGSGDTRREGTIVLWSQGDRVFATTGNLNNRDILQMAESVQ